MSEIEELTDRQLLERIHRSQAVHEARHESLDALVAKTATAIWGNGKVGLTSKVYLLMSVLGLVGTLVVGLLTHVLLY